MDATASCVFWLAVTLCTTPADIEAGMDAVALAQWIAFRSAL